MVRVEQLSALMDFLECRKELALGRLGRSNEGRSLANRQWGECATILNSVSEDCPQKSATEWRAFYADYKSKLLKKIKYNKREMSATGGGKRKVFILTPIQERLFDILGRDLGDPLPGVRLEPQTCTFTAGEFHADDDVTAGPSININNFMETQREELGPAEALENNNQQLLEVWMEVPMEPDSEVMPEPPMQLSGDSRPTPIEHVRRPRRRHTSPRFNIDAQRSTLNRAQERMERIESLKADAILEHARATNRLAAALEKIGEKLGALEALKINKNYRGRIMSDSDDSE